MTMHTLFRMGALSMSLAALTLSACSTLNKGQDNAANAGPLAPALASSSLEINHDSDRGCAPAALAALAAGLADSAQVAAIEQTVFRFGTDKYDLNSDANHVLAAHSQLLKAQQNLRVKITGHTDERGTADYNLALGERRANTVATFLATAGVQPEHMQVISYGEEKPVALGTDEAAWAQNRRVELSYAGCAQ